MSKSKGNFYTVRDVLEGKVTGREVDPAVLRYELMKTHYRKNADFTRKGLEDSARAIQRLREAENMAFGWSIQSEIRNEERFYEVKNKSTVVQDFTAALSDDLNISGAMGVIFSHLNKGKWASDETFVVLREANPVLGVLKGAFSGVIAPGRNKIEYGTADREINKLCSQLDAARADKDYTAADTIRQQLIDAGYDVKTTKAGTIATKRLA